MSRRGQPWFRLWAEFRSDPKVQMLSFDDQRHYVCILCMKCEGILDGGEPDGVRDRLVGRGLGLDGPTASEVKRRLLEVGLIADDWQPAKWEERQFSHDVSTARVQRHRDRLKSGNGDETFQKRFTTVSGTAPERDADPESDTEPEGEGARATQLPKHFGLTEARRLVALQAGIAANQVKRVFDKFTAHYHAAPCDRPRHWDSVWQLWCSRELEFVGARGRAEQARGVTHEQAAAGLKSLGDRMRAGGGG